MSTSSPLRESAKIASTPYQVVRVVGAGGTSYVYEVVHAELGKRFMLKTLEQSSTRGEALVESLRKEWRALAQLEHPNIVRVSDAGVSANGLPFFVMERLIGETLAKTILRERELPVAEALRVAAALLEALAAAHEIGIIHRDVKPGNVFLTMSGKVKLLDFGIARDQFSTDGAHSFGTPRYLSPEQAAGEPLDDKTDVYSSGLVLFEMLTGRSPFEGAEGTQWLYCHVNKLPAPCSELARLHAPAQRIPKELDALVASLLEKDPRRRPDARTAAQRVHELMESATPEPDTNADTLAFPEPVMDIVAKLRDGDAARAEGDPVFDVPAKRDAVTAPRLPSTAVMVDTVAALDADATLAGTPEAIAALRGFRGFEPGGDSVSDPEAAADTPEGIHGAPRSFRAQSLVVVLLLLGGVGFGAFQWGARSERTAQEGRREPSAVAPEREPTGVVAPSGSVPAPIAPVASEAVALPVPLPVPSALAVEVTRTGAVSAGRAPATSRKSPRDSTKKKAPAIDPRFVSVAKGGTWVDETTRVQLDDGTWVDLPPAGLGDEEPAKPKGTAKPTVTAKKKAAGSRGGALK